MHAHNIVHYDLRLHNVMVDMHSEVKILSFGFAKCVGHALQRISTVAHYAAPELLTAQASSDLQKVCERAVPSYSSSHVGIQGLLAAQLHHDIWSLGCMLYTLSTGMMPWGMATPSDPDYLLLTASKLRFVPRIDQDQRRVCELVEI